MKELNMTHEIKVRGIICPILQDYGNQKLIKYRGTECLLHTDRDGSVVLRDSKTGKYIGLSADLHFNCCK